MKTRRVITQAGIRYQLTAVRAGVRQRLNFSTEAEALRAQAAMLDGQGNDKAGPVIVAQAASQTAGMTVEAAIVRWRQWSQSRGRHSPRYQQRIDVALVPLRAFMQDKGIVLCREFKKALFDEYLHTRAEAGVSVNSIHQEYAIIAAAFEFAVSRDLLDANPLHGFWRGITASPIVPDVLSFDEMTQVFKSIEHVDVRKAVWFLAASGCRYSEMAHVQAGDINQQFNTVHFHRATKRGLSRQCTLATPLPFDLPSGPDAPAFMFDGQPWTQYALIHRLRTACKRAGVHQINIHGLRHYAATHRLASGQNVYTVMAELGWRSLSMVMRYVQVSGRFKGAKRHSLEWLAVWLFMVKRHSKRHWRTTAQEKNTQKASIYKGFQLVEQRTENPCVDSSILSPGTTSFPSETGRRVNVNDAQPDLAIGTSPMIAEVKKIAELACRNDRADTA